MKLPTPKQIGITLACLAAWTISAFIPSWIDVLLIYGGVLGYYACRDDWPFKRD